MQLVLYLLLQVLLVDVHRAVASDENLGGQLRRLGRALQTGLEMPSRPVLLLLFSSLLLSCLN